MCVCVTYLCVLSLYPVLILTALQALYYLAQVPSNRPLMKSEVGLLLSVNRIINRCLLCLCVYL